MRLGVAKVDITPDGAVYLAGYAARTERSSGVYLPLEARALALESDAPPLVWLTADLIGFDPFFADPLIERVATACRIPPEHVLLSCSHTHCGPTIRRADIDRYGPDALAGIDRLTDRLVEVCRRACDDLAPGRLSCGVGECRMGIHRRLQHDGRTIMAPNPAGPVDPELPVLVVESDSGERRAVLVSYACHPTTMGGLLLGPDYIGYLRQGIVEQHPDLQVLFAQGCGGDIKVNNTSDGRFNAGPLEAVERMGRQVAEATLAALAGPLVEVHGPVHTRRVTIELPLQQLSRDEYEAFAGGSNSFWATWAKSVLAKLDSGKPLATALPFTLQTVTIGDEFCLAALGGEVCVEIGLHLKRRLRERYSQVVVVAYSHGMRGYQAAQRQFADGGYEVEEWCRYSADLPGPYEPAIEQQIVAAAVDLAGG